MPGTVEGSWEAVPGTVEEEEVSVLEMKGGEVSVLEMKGEEVSVVVDEEVVEHGMKVVVEV